jgi:hypothetical protein
VIFRVIQSLKVSIFSPRNKRVLLHGIQIFWRDTKISANITYRKMLIRPRLYTRVSFFCLEQEIHRFVFMNSQKNLCRVLLPSGKSVWGTKSVNDKRRHWQDWDKNPCLPDCFSFLLIAFVCPTYGVSCINAFVF